jgi:hypothetical protein
VKEWGKIKFTKRLDELKIKFFKSNDKNKYYVSLDDLNKIASSRHWIHELDEFSEYKEKSDTCPDPDGLDFGIENHLEEENKKLKLELGEMKKKIAELEILLLSEPKKQVREITEVESDDELSLKTEDIKNITDSDVEIDSHDSENEALQLNDDNIYLNLKNLMKKKSI